MPRVFETPCNTIVKSDSVYITYEIQSPPPPLLPKKKYPRNINSIVQHCQKHSSLPYPSNVPLLFSPVCKDSARTKKKGEKKKKNSYFRLASLVINLRREGRRRGRLRFHSWRLRFQKGEKDK